MEHALTTTLLDERTRVVIDSGATAHTFMNGDLVLDKQPSALKVQCASGNILHVSHTGKVKLTDRVTLHDVAVVPRATSNLISMPRILAAGYKVLGDGDKIEVIGNTGKVWLTFFRERPNGLYVLFRKKERADPSRGMMVSLPKPSPASSSKPDVRQSESSSARAELDKARAVKSAVSKDSKQPGPSKYIPVVPRRETRSSVPASSVRPAPSSNNVLEYVYSDDDVQECNLLVSSGPVGRGPRDPPAG